MTASTCPACAHVAEPQLLFNPGAGGEEFAAKAIDGGLASMVMQSISMCDKVMFRVTDSIISRASCTPSGL